jgi:DNA-binding beta-propeller fold protein YncE
MDRRSEVFGSVTVLGRPFAHGVVLAVFVAAMVIALAAVPAALGADSVYWGNTVASKLSFVALNASTAGDLVTTGATVSGPQGVALDPAAGRIYWANAVGKISFANLNGSGGGDLGTGGATVSTPAGVALDSAAGRIYWANTVGNKISYANLNGSGGGNLTTTGATVDAPEGVALNPATGRIYWANLFGNKISYANLNGSGGGDLSTSGATVNGPAGVALDPAAGRIYWANADDNRISFANLSGSGAGDFLISGATVNVPVGVALDPGAGRIYWANQNGNKISYANLTAFFGVHFGSDLATLAATVDLPDFLALLKAPSGTGAPAITGGSTIGASLTCSQGSWAADLLPAFLYRAPQGFGYQWARNGGDLAGATSTTLAASALGNYTCRVTATNHAGSAQQTSVAHRVLATLTVGKAGRGAGTVTSAPAGISCGATCSAAFAAATSVTLTAAPSSRSLFTGWSGACTGASSCTLTMDANKTVTATFVRACVVPKVKGNKLSSAKTAVKRAHCSVGRVKKAFSSRVKKGRVIAQKPKPGVKRPPGSKVNLQVSKGKKP